MQTRWSWNAANFAGTTFECLKKIPCQTISSVNYVLRAHHNHLDFLFESSRHSDTSHSTLVNPSTQVEILLCLVMPGYTLHPQVFVWEPEREFSHQQHFSFHELGSTRSIQCQCLYYKYHSHNWSVISFKNELCLKKNSTSKQKDVLLPDPAHECSSSLQFCLKYHSSHQTHKAFPFCQLLLE